MPNDSLTAGQVIPGFFGKIIYNSKGGGEGPNFRLLVWGYVGATAQATPNVPFLPSGQQDANDKCERGSDLALAFGEAMSQPEAQGAEVWLLPIAAPSGGVASIYKLKLFGAPTKAGSIQLWINSQPVPAVGFTADDTATTIATALRDAILAMLDLPLGTVTSSGAEITIPYRHKGQTGEDFPFRCNVTPNGTGINVSPGQMLMATNVTGAGSLRVSMGALSVSTALTGGQTPATVAAAVVASFNADTYPVRAVVDAVPEQVNFFFNNDRDVRRMSAAVITSSALTANLGSGATDGSGSASSLTYNGTLGTGAPSLTSALTSLQGLPAYRSHAAPWVDAATVGAIATRLETDSDGSMTGQKQQTLVIGSALAASVAGAIATGSSPNLTTTAPHYSILWSEDAPVKAFSLAVRVAAARAARWLGAPQFNWNGFQLKGNQQYQILLPPRSPSPTAQNTALRTYALAPVVRGASGNLEVVKGRTTSLAVDLRLWAWSTEAQAAYHHYDLGRFLRERFEGGSVLRFSEPKAPRTFDTQSFKSAAQESMRRWEGQGNYDGADALKDYVVAVPDAFNPFRMNLDYPESPVLDLDQVAFAGFYTSPAA